MVQSDALFQHTGHITNDTENDNIILLSNNIFIKMIDMELHDDIKDPTTNNDFSAKAVEALKIRGPTPIRSKLKD